VLSYHTSQRINSKIIKRYNYKRKTQIQISVEMRFPITESVIRYAYFHKSNRKILEEKQQYLTSTLPLSV